MDENARLELLQQHRTGQQKYDYFLMALAGAAIAFSIQQTANTTLSWPQIFLGTAVIFWGFSVFAGCKRQERIHTLINLNINLWLYPDFPKPNKLFAPLWG